MTGTVCSASRTDSLRELPVGDQATEMLSTEASVFVVSVCLCAMGTETSPFTFKGGGLFF